MAEVNKKNNEGEIGDKTPIAKEQAPSIDAALRFSKPIEIRDLLLNEAGDFSLAKLKIFDIQPANPLLPVEINSLFGNCIEVSYYRKQVKLSVSPELENKLGPDDLALIARIFLLNKVSKLKEAMRISLDELAEELENISLENKKLEVNDQSSAKRKSIELYIKHFRITKFKSILSSLSNFVMLGKFFRQVNLSFIKERLSRLESYLKGCFLALCSLIEHCLSRLVKKASSSSIFQIFIWITGVLVIVDLLFYLLAPRRPHFFETQATTLILMLVFLAICFVLLALNFKDKGDRAKNKVYEKTNRRLSDVLSELTQTNANVASLNIFPKPIGQASEMLLRHFDQVLHVKEAVTGLEKVILARQRDVAALVFRVKEHQEHARRAATAAAGGIFTGFFTFEVGERVFKFMHLIHGQDERSMFFWLTTEAGPFANPDLVNAQKGMPPELKKALCDSKGMKDCKTVAQPFDSVLLQEHFIKQYQQSEMHAYGVLLAITLVVSLIAAAIGWRKPAEEQAGVHGGHH